MKGIVLIFDVETSGLYRNNQPMELQPYVLQFSYILYNLKNHDIIRKVNSYVNVGPNVTITPEISAINGCTRELCDKGKKIDFLLSQFYYDFTLAEYIVAHNIDFDSKIITLEFKRNWNLMEKIAPNALKLFDADYLKSTNQTCICTMKETTQLVKAPHKNAKPEDIVKKNFKWPTLSELHHYLFGFQPQNLHNSMVDVLITLKCFLFYKCNYKIEDQTMLTYQNLYI